MDTLSYKTQSAKPAEVEQKWILVDATNQTLGRFCSKIALRLRGKHLPGYTPHVEMGDKVVVINAEKIRLTGKKWTDKEYLRHTGYPGGQRSLTAKQVLDRKPEKLIEMAVKGMLPKNRLGRKIYGNLNVYAGAEHPHEGQNPETLEITG